MPSPVHRASPSPTVLKRPPHAGGGGSSSDAGVTILQFAAAAAALPTLFFLLRLGYAVYAVAAAGGVASDLNVVVAEPWWRSSRPDLTRSAAAVDAWPMPRVLHVVPPLPAPASSGGTAAAAPWDGTAPAASCRRLHPDWKFKVWDESEALELVDESYPWAAAALDSYSDPEQRAAALRLLVLHAHGGVALSAGVGCRHRLDALRQFNAVLVPLAPHPSSGDGTGGDGDAIASTLLLAAPKGHPFLLTAAQALSSFNHRYGGTALTALVSTGDVFLSRQLAAWSSSSSSSSGDGRAVLALPASLLGAGPYPEQAIFWVGGSAAATGSGAEGGGAEGSLAAAAAAAAAAAVPGAPASGGGASRRAGPAQPPAAPPGVLTQGVAPEWRAWDAALALWVADHLGSVFLLLSFGFLAGYGAARYGPHLPLTQLSLPIARTVHDRDE